MLKDRSSPETLSPFLQYLAEHQNGKQERLPALTDLSQQLGLSVASLREQLEVARALGFVEVRPRTGMRSLPYTFRPAIQKSLSFAMATDPEYFKDYSELRKNVETAFWLKAVSLLTSEDHAALKELVRLAWDKMRSQPVQIPHPEHRALHMLIYRRLNNIFVSGILEVYWDTYEAVGLDVYTNYGNLESVWQYHERIVDAISLGDFASGYQAFLDHMDLLYRRTPSAPNQKFE